MTTRQLELEAEVEKLKEEKEVLLTELIQCKTDLELLQRELPEIDIFTE